MLDAVGERHDPDVIVVLRRRVRQLERRLHREIEPRHTGRHVGGHQPAGIQHEQHLLAALGLVLARDHLGAPRCRLPIDVPQIVTRYPLAQRLKQPPLTQPANRFGPRLPPSHGVGH